MLHTRFMIRKFKGIEEVTLRLDKPVSDVTALVGLNESGKTTILEALNYHNYGEGLHPLDLPGLQAVAPYDLIPINLRANFNDTISVTADYRLSDEDETRFARELRRGTGFRVRRPVGTLRLSREQDFENSLPADSRRVAEFELYGRTKRGKIDRLVSVETDVFDEASDILESLAPPVVYFPDALFDFPDRIYLEDTGIDNRKHRFYRDVLQDVLDAMDGNLNVEKHILRRAQSDRKSDKRSLDSVLLQMGSHISSTVFEAWDRIFGRRYTNKKVRIGCEWDEEAETHYVAVSIEDGADHYTIGERSQGFRWFFLFLLFTHYRGFRASRAKGVLFLLDEPASNLHPSAQSELLGSLNRLEPDCRVLYTTHSQYLINPDWLDSTFVVQNAGLDYEGDVISDFTARSSMISAVPYRRFVTSHPDKTSYIQPILEVLAYQPSKLERLDPVVLVEGKYDAQLIALFRDVYSLGLEGFGIAPGVGADSLDDLIRIYLAWGCKFIVLLDSDRPGEEAKKRYLQDFGPFVAERVFTLVDLKPQWKGRKLEQLFHKQDRLRVIQHLYPGASSYKKGIFFSAVQELYLRKIALSLRADSTLKNFQHLFESISSMMEVHSQE